MTIGSVEPLKQLYTEWGHRVQFVDVLVRQAHPGPEVRPYRTSEEKARDAARYKRDEQIPWTVLVDDLGGTVHRQYGMLADPAFLIGVDGRITFYNYWTHAATLHKAIQQLLVGGGASVIGDHRSPHPLAAIADGWRGLRRGLPQSMIDLETAMPGAASGLWLGYKARSVLAPVALSSHPWPRGRKVAAAVMMAALGGIAVATVGRAPNLRRARTRPPDSSSLRTNQREVAMDEASRPDREDIERRAYRRFEERGRTHGDDQADWFEAERQAREEAQRRRDQSGRAEESVTKAETRDQRRERATIDDKSARASGTGPTSTPTGTGPSGNVRNPGTAVSGGPTEAGR